MEKLNEYFQIALDKVVFYAPKVVLAGLILWIGFKIVKKLNQLLDLSFKKAGLSDEIRPFFLSFLNIVMKAAILMAVASILGADLTSLVALIAAIGFAIGMALQGSLGNFASGILILTLKPYKVNDYVSIDDYFGKVKEIGIFNTTIKSPGLKTLIIPNSKVTDGTVINYSEEGVVRLELEVTMPYDEDFPKIKEIIKNALAPLDKIIKEKPLDIGIIAFDTHFVKIGVLPFVKPDDYWEVTYESYKNIKRAFSEHGIKVAYSEGVEMGAIGK